MKRRAFIAGLGSVGIMSRVCRGQQKVPTIGLLGANTPAVQSRWTAALIQRLHEHGWIEGRTVAIEARWAEGRDERYAEIAAEFVRLKVDVILTHATPATLAAKQATSAIPIVFAAAGNPIGTGLRSGFGETGRKCDWPFPSANRYGWQASGVVARNRSPAPHIGDHDQCSQPQLRGGSSGTLCCCPRARPRSRDSRCPARGRHRAGFRSAQGSCRCASRRCLPASAHQRHSS